MDLDNLYTVGSRVYARNPKKGPGNAEWVQGLVVDKNGKFDETRV